MFSHACCLVVTVGISLSISPASVTTLLDNEQVSFNCQSAPSTLSPLSINWFINGVDLNSSIDLEIFFGTSVVSFTNSSSGVAASVLNVTATERSHNASIVCRIMAQGDPPIVVMSAPAVLTVQCKLRYHYVWRVHFYLLRTSIACSFNT